MKIKKEKEKEPEEGKVVLSEKLNNFFPKGKDVIENKTINEIWNEIPISNMKKNYGRFWSYTTKSRIF